MHEAPQSLSPPGQAQTPPGEAHTSPPLQSPLTQQSEFAMHLLKPDVVQAF